MSHIISELAMVTMKLYYSRLPKTHSDECTHTSNYQAVCCIQFSSVQFILSTIVTTVIHITIYSIHHIIPTIPSPLDLFVTTNPWHTHSGIPQARKCIYKSCTCDKIFRRHTLNFNLLLRLDIRNTWECIAYLSKYIASARVFLNFGSNESLYTR